MKIRIIVYSTIIGFFILSGVLALVEFNRETPEQQTLLDTWSGYKHYFIEPDGRVKRPLDEDTVSEGQAYAMFRAVCMSDKETFDNCYRWTEKNLSRLNKMGDNLLAWHWKDGQVIDWMPAADADIDYALSLIFAHSRWKDSAPKALTDYGKKAKAILDDILNLETFSTASKKLYLAPWILKFPADLNNFPVNPSYYSPAHFRVFYGFTKDQRWLDLADTTYYILDSLAREFGGQKGVGLIPDWCSVDKNDKFSKLEGKSPDFGWESVRIPIRVSLDYFWFKSEAAKKFFEKGFCKFLEDQWQKNKKVFCEYAYSGQPIKKYDNPLFYSAYTLALKVIDSKYYLDFLNKTQSFLKEINRYVVYMNSEEYYVNSLSWLAEGVKSGVVKNLLK